MTGVLPRAVGLVPPAYGNLRDRAVEYVRRAVVAGDLAPGSKIDQDEIAALLGISRAPVREALIELAQKGFVDTPPRRGAFVARLTVQDVEDHYAVLAMVTGLATGRAVAALDEHAVAELRRVHEEIAATPDENRRRELDRHFLSEVARAGGSGRLDSILVFLGGALAGSMYFGAPGWAANEEFYRERLLAAFEAGDVEAAIRTGGEEHMSSCARLSIAHLRERGYWDARPGAALGTRVSRS